MATERDPNSLCELPAATLLRIAHAQIAPACRKQTKYSRTPPRQLPPSKTLFALLSLHGVVVCSVRTVSKRYNVLDSLYNNTDDDGSIRVRDQRSHRTSGHRGDSEHSDGGARGNCWACSWKAKNDKKRVGERDREEGGYGLVGRGRGGGRERRADPVHPPAVYIFSPYQRNQELENAQALPPRPLLSFASGITSPFSCARVQQSAAMKEYMAPFVPCSRPCPVSTAPAGR